MRRALRGATGGHYAPAMARSDGGMDQVRGNVWLLAGALLLIALAILLLLRPLLAPAPATRVAASAAEHAAGTRSGGSDERRAAAPPSGDDRRRARPVPRAERVPPAPAAASDDAVPADDAADDADGAGDEPSGIALFPPPGTDPPKPGIIVPEGFELPPGYVRHHQVTDDGTQLPPILMFHPDFEWVDAQGNPIALPEDHVVPPDLAPPGMPVEILDVPETRIEVVAPPPAAEP